jgi:hypothetical protein
MGSTLTQLLLGLAAVCAVFIAAVLGGIMLMVTPVIGDRSARDRRVRQRWTRWRMAGAFVRRVSAVLRLRR